MKKLLSILLLAPACFAQLTFSTHTINITQVQARQGSPYATSFSVTGTGNLIVSSITSSLFNMQAATKVVICTAVTDSSCPPATAAPALVRVYLSGFTNNQLAPGTYSSVVKFATNTSCITSCNVTVNLTVVPLTPASIKTSSGTTLGCVSSNPLYFDQDSCTIPSSTPGTFALPAVGSTYTDGNFGGTVKILSRQDTDGSFTALTGDVDATNFNADGSLIATFTNGGVSRMISSVDGHVVYTGAFRASPGNNTWDSTDPNTYYTQAVGQKTIKQVTLPTLTATTIYTYGGSAPSINTGGGTDISKDGWFVFYTADASGTFSSTTGVEQKVCIINLHNVSQVFCRDVAADLLPGFVARAILISKGINTPNNKRYIWLVGGGNFTNVASDVFFSYTPGGTTVDYEYTLPQHNYASQFTNNKSYGVLCDAFASAQGNLGSNCFLAPHQDMAEVNGVQYTVADETVNNLGFPIVRRIDQGALLYDVAAEVGGSAYYPLPLTPQTDFHIGCAKNAPYCVVSTDGAHGQAGFLITGVTAGSVPTLTYYVATTGSDSNPGTLAAPFLTIEKAATVVAAGSTVIVKDGTYSVTCSSGNNAVDLTTAGTAGAPIVIKAANRGGAILDGTNTCAYLFKVHTGTNYQTIQGFVLKHGLTGGIFVDNTVDHTTIQQNEIASMGNVVDTSTGGGHVGVLTNSGSTNTLLNANYFHDIGRTNMGCPVTTCTARDQNMYLEGTNVTAINNIVALNTTGAGGFGAAIKVGTGYLIANNTFYGPVPNGEHGQLVIGDDLHGSFGDFTIENNIFSLPSGTGGVVTCGINLTGTNTIDHNIANGGSVTGVFGGEICSGSTGSIPQSNNSVADPLFTNPTGGNFTIPTNSPAVNAGVTILVASPDYNNILRPTSSSYCLGAYEAGSGVAAPNLGTITTAVPFTCPNAQQPTAPCTIAINAVQGMTGVNGLCTVTNIAGPTFQCVGATYTGTYTAGTGAFVASTPLPSNLPHQNEVMLLDLSQIATRNFTVTRLANSRDNTISNDRDNSSFYGQAHCSIAFDATAVTCIYNNMLPDNLGVMSIATGVGVSTITITSPTAAQVLTGYSGFQFRISTPGPTTAKVCYVVDAYMFGCTTTPPWSLAYNTYYNFNGPHQVAAFAYDVLGNLVAASPPVAFTGANAFWKAWTPGFSVTPSTSATNLWAGSQTLTATVTGSQSGSDTLAFHFYIDSNEVGGVQTGATSAVTFNTNNYSNGPHTVAVTAIDATGGNVNCSGALPFGGAGEWSRSVQFSNTSNPVKLLLNASEMYLAPTQTFALSGFARDTNGILSAAAPVYYSQTPVVATVGQTTGLVTAVSRGNAKIRAMSPTTSGSDLHVVAAFATTTQLSSAAFSTTSVGKVLQITGGAGFTPGLYEITNYESGTTVDVTGVAGTTGASNGTFRTGPTTSTWAQVWTSNILPHFGTDGTILSAYDPAKSFINHSIFVSSAGLTDQPYFPGFGTDYSQSGYNNVEIGFMPSTMSTTSPTQTAFTTAQAAWVASWQALLAPYPSIKINLTGDNMTGTSTDLYSTTRGAWASFSPTAAQIVFSSWTGQANNTITNAMQDAVNSSWDHKPLQGPVSFSGAAQSGLTSIVASSGTCTTHWTDWSTNSSHRFIITGATTAGLNTTAGSTYLQTTVDANTFTFPCGAANGTYNATTDSALLIEPYVAAWFAGNTDYVHYDAFQNIRLASLAGGRGLLTWPNAAGSTTASIANWGTLGTQSIPPVSTLSDTVDLYTSTGVQTYLGSRFLSTALVTQYNDKVHGYYGTGFNPTVPFSLLTSGTPVGYGLEGTILTVSSCTGNTITTSAAHGITTVYPGITKGTVTGSSGCDGNYYIITAPSTTTLTVARSVTSFTGTGTGGTLTWSGGGTETITSATASGTIICGNGVCANVAGITSDANLSRRRGQTFTISGNTLSGFNSHTFLDLPENITTLTSTIGYREIPNLTSSGGTLALNPDNYDVRGRNQNQISDANVGYEFASAVDSYFLRAAAERLYKYSPAAQGYDSTHGFYNPATTGNTTFGDTCNTTIQLGVNPHFDNATSVPVFHGVSTAARLMNRVRSYLLQPTAQTVPDYGTMMPATFRTGANGKLLGVLNLSDTPVTQAVDLSSLTGPAGITCYYATYSGIRLQTYLVGTASATYTFDPQGALVCVAPATPDYSPPTIAANVSDITGASTIAVQAGYDAYWLASPDALTTAATNCGSTGSCTIPLDPKIGTIYYKLFYLNGSGVVLGASDIQQI